MGRTPCEDENRYWYNASTSPGIPKTASILPEAKRRAWSSLWYSVMGALEN